MARYDIIGLHYMSSGEKRGILNVDLRLNNVIGKRAQLLGSTFQDGSELSDGYGRGIVTESGKYNYISTDYISNFKTRGKRSNPLALEDDSQALLLNERQTYIEKASLHGSYSYDKDTSVSALIQNPPYAIQLMTGRDLSDTHTVEEYLQWNKDHSLINCDLIFETDMLANEKAMMTPCGTQGQYFYPLYDLKDVSVKANAQKASVNPRVPKNIGQKSSESSRNNKQDVYFTFGKTPIKFCQFHDSNNTYSYILSKPVTKQPYYLSTDIAGNYFSDECRMNFSYNLAQDDIDTFLYRSPSDYGYQTYAQYLSSLPQERLANQNILSLFDQYYDIKGIQYNYMVSMVETGQSKNDAMMNYDDGNVFFDKAQITKNAFNSLYSVDVSAIGRQYQFMNCRQYCDIMGDDRHITLKYYDNLKYSVAKSHNGPQEAVRQYMVSSTIYPYQKVEQVYNVSSQKATRHKSNLFSIKVKETNLDDESVTGSDKAKKLRDKLRFDIKNAIFDFTKNIAPANTQLFDVFFVN